MDKEGHPIDFLLPSTRAREAAAACLRKAMRSQGRPETIPLDKRGANTAASTHSNKTRRTAIGSRHSKYLTNIVEQAPRAGKGLTRPLRGFKSVWAARGTSAGIEVRQAIGKGQRLTPEDAPQTPAEHCSALAA